MHALMIKLSSLGDIIHTLPAITDAAKALPGLTFDWVVDRSFADMPKLNRYVNSTVLSSHRKWKKDFWGALCSGEVNAFIKALRKQPYDYVIDAQVSLKSALYARVARGIPCGMDSQSVREWGAHLGYKQRYFISKEMHAVTRIRALCAAVFNYPLPSTPADYGFDYARFKKPAVELPKNYLMFMVNTSWPSKRYPDVLWGRLMELVANDYPVVLSWGNPTEHARAQAFASCYSHVWVLPKLTLPEVTYVVAQASGTVGLDTGLSHLAAALNIPSVTLYSATSPKLIGAMGQYQTFLQPNFECITCYRRHCHYQGTPHEIPQCFLQHMPAERVWEALEARMSFQVRQ